ncbi:adenylyl-sulfate kinase [Desulfobacterium sp. N47]|uniref:Adenylyl-sulfate kinase n=1 Tax=uncultured Desulfobacterium sp. TaxID=201089 RepID=E1YEK6_9BACT|nr:Adenylyl-sulfate kinase [uncultured Desulfobacterium sp.]
MIASNMCSENTICYNSLVTRIDREKLNGHKSVVIWFTGLSGSGKSTIAHEVEKRLFGLACRTFVFDGDNVRHGLCGDLGFTPENRKENIRRIGEMVKLFLEAGVITLSAFISPYKADRNWLRELVSPEKFIEIYCRCPIEVCEKRDVKGLYAKARAGLITNYTGITSAYEEPDNSDLVIDTNLLSPEQSVDIVLNHLINDKKIIF